jgi:hypothetical protein
MKKLKLEFRNEFNKEQGIFQVGGGVVMMTPMLDEDYWVFRIQLHKDQSLLAFPKFWTMGIGFAKEEDWNTNLPYTCTTYEIYKHILKNKKYKEITAKGLMQAIETLQKASKYYMENEVTKKQAKNADAMALYFTKVQKFVTVMTPSK